MRRRPPRPRPVLYLVGCAAPPIRRIRELVELLERDGWTVCLIITPSAADWLDDTELRSLSKRHSLRWQPRHPDDPDPLPPADALVVAPATFNTINKWAAGISDTLALGILNELLGLGVPILVSPYAKPALAAHPAFARSVQTLQEAGVRFTEAEALRPPGRADGPFRWSAVLDPLRPEAAA